MCQHASTSKPVFLNHIYPEDPRMNLQLVFCHFPSTEIILLNMTLYNLYYEINGYFECVFSNLPHPMLRVTVLSHCSQLATSQISLETVHNSERAWGPNLRTCEEKLSTGLDFTRVMWIEAAGQRANTWQHLDKMVPDHPKWLCNHWI